MSEIPNGWMNCKLNDVIEDVQAGFASGKKDVPNGLMHLRMNNISVDGRLNLELVRTVPSKLANDKKHYLMKGDVLICTTNSGKLVGKCALFDQEGDFAFSNHLTRLRPNGSVDCNYLSYQLWLLWREGAFEHACKHWVNQSTLPKAELLSTDFLLPPLNEQHRIVAKLEKLLSGVNAAQERLATLPQILKRFRQSVLAAACSGRLTADSRKCQLHMTNKSSEAGEDLSLGWCEYSFRDIANATSGFAFSSRDFISAGVPAIKISNVQYGQFETKNQEYLPESFLEEYSGFIVSPGTLLLALTRPITNNTVKVCLYPESGKTALLNQRVCKLEPLSMVTKEYLHLYMQTEPFKDQIAANLSETLQPNLSPKALDDFYISLPALAEQQEIVHRVKVLFDTANALEARYQKAKAHVDKLTQSILAKAFRGELVPQDPTDEPASDLLQRIRVRTL